MPGVVVAAVTVMGVPVVAPHLPSGHGMPL